MSELQVTEGKDGCTFRVHLVPRSRQDTVAGLYGQALRVRLKTPPVEGRANRALCAFLADRLDVPVDAVEILSGHTSRSKIIRVTGVQPVEIRALLGVREGD